MAVTAKLSRRFYERFGDEITNELVDWLNSVDATYRSDLRELNELNFARFSATQKQLMAEQDARWEKRFGDLMKWMFIYWTGTIVTLGSLILART